MNINKSKKPNIFTEVPFFYKEKKIPHFSILYHELQINSKSILFQSG